MKSLSTILFLLTCLASHATKYYVKAAGGTGTGLSDAAAWSIAKLNSTTLSPGDSVFFKRGDTFNGAITVATSGNSSNRIFYGAYGTGARPIINGMATMTSWSSVGSNLYEAAVNSGTTLNMVTINGSVFAKGRYPNASDPNGGYLPVESHTPTGLASDIAYYNVASSITSSALTGSWTGAEIVNRKNFFTFDRQQITSQSGTTLNYTSVTAFEQGNSFGFFVQNSPATLDQQGEWYYNPATHMLRMYSVVNPSGLVVKADTTETFVTLNNKSYLTFDNLSFIGADTAAFNITGGSSYVTVQNCDILYSGTEAFSTPNSSSANYIRIDGCNIRDANSYAMQMYNHTGTVISNNIIKNIGMLPGMARSGSEGYGGITLNGTGDSILYNIVDSIGGVGISPAGNSNYIKGNYVNFYCYIMCDIAGIYLHGSSFNKVIDNICNNGYGGYYGTPFNSRFGAHGIYADEGENQALIEGNTCINNISSGIYIHKSNRIKIRKNNLFENGSGAILFRDDDATDINKIYTDSLLGNLFYSSNVSQYLVSSGTIGTNSYSTMVSVSDSNIYYRPFNPYASIRTDSTSSIYRWYDHIGLQGQFGYELHGVTPAVLPRYNVITAGSNMFSNSNCNTTSGFYSNASKSILSVDTKLDGFAVRSDAVGGIGLDPGTEIQFGAVPGGHVYRIRGSVIGSTNTENLRARFHNGSYSYFSDEYGIPLRTTRSEFEVYVTTDGSKGNMTMALENRSPSFPYWIDNITIQDVTSYTSINPADSLRIEFNTTSAPSIVTLGANYRDLYGTAYTGRLTLAPFKSALLRREMNVSPSAIVGFNSSITLPTSTKLLNGSSSSDADGSIASYFWKQVSGPITATISSPTSATTNATGMTTAGSYGFQLRVTDNAGFVDSATVTITVIGNPAPTVNAGTDIIITLPVDSTILKGLGTDDGSLTYTWSKVSGPGSSTIVDATNDTTTVRNLVAGVHKFKLTATDGGSQTAVDTVQVTVLANPAPVANAGADQVITLPVSSVTLNAGTSSDDVAVVSYAWVRISGPGTVAIASPTASSTLASGLGVGAHTFVVTVTDNGGATDTDTVIVTVNAAANVPPVANAGPDKLIALPLSTVTLTGSGTDADGTVTGYLWTKVSGPTAHVIVSPTAATTVITGLAEGTYVFRLRVTDNNGAIDTADVTVVVTGSYTPSASSIRVGLKYEIRNQ